VTLGVPKICSKYFIGAEEVKTENSYLRIRSRSNREDVQKKLMKNWPTPRRPLPRRI
jgi:hypothetical protein